MAQHLNPGQTCRRWCALILLVAPVMSAIAQSVADPTRPPDLPVSAGMAASAAAGTGAPAPATGPVLESILMSATHAEAIISGKAVRPGDRIATGQVVRISESEVTVRTNVGLQTLKLFPGIEKRYAAAEQPAAPAKRDKTKAKQ